jgi:hypothetical protein
MSDDELLHALRNSKGWPTLGKAAADRIEKLEAKLDLSEGALDVASRSWGECQRMLEQTEGKLAKAVEIALEECPFAWGTGSYNDWWYDRRTTLAELKGEKDE